MRKLRILFLVGLILFALCSCDKKREVALVQNKQTVKGVSLNKNRTIYGIDDKIIPEDSRLLKAIFYNKSNLLVITQNEEDTIILRLYDIYTGRIRSGCMIQNGDSSLAAECFVTDTFQTVIRSEDHNRFFIFDKSFRLILSDHDLPKQVTSIVVSRDGESVYYIKENGKGIYQYDRKSRQSKLKMQLSMEDKVKISLDEVSRDGRYLSAHYEKGEIDSG